MYTTGKSKSYLLALLLCVCFFSCSSIGFELPQGPRGENGKSAYELWKEEVKAGRINWPAGQVEITDFLIYIKGEKGDKGADGMSAYEQWKKMIAQGDVADPHSPGRMWPSSQNAVVDFWNFLSGTDGKSPFIGSNGNWWIGGMDTGVKAAGKNGVDGLNGKDGASAYELWKQLVAKAEVNWPKDQVSQADFFLFLKGKDGANGVTPHVGSNGNWYVGSTDTGVAAKGSKGDKGDKGDDGLSPFVGSNGNWWVGNTDTNVPAKGMDGLSPRIGENNNWWIGNKDTGISAKGQDGKDGKNGLDGQNGKDGKDGKDGLDGQNGKDGKDGKDGLDGQNGKDGKDGQNGLNGKSAYELWKMDVENGNALGKDGKVWPAGKNTLNDFYAYLSGADGKDGKDGADGKNGKDGQDGQNGLNGKSAYELWHEAVMKGNIQDPANPQLKWSADRVSEMDFFAYLAGRSGFDGNDGLSAYEVWKNDLAKRCHTPFALTDHNTGKMWDCNRNSLDDFYDYLRGKDGKDGNEGKDGKPGEPGTPGVEVTIVRGIPNVIAQYSQPEYGEYVRTTDGGVLYKVYDEEGNLAPGAKVRGLPGVNPGKMYIADNKGEFVLPKEDLPEVKELNQHWGVVKEVTLQGKAPRMSAQNTYVPNRVRMRMVLFNDKNPLIEKQILNFRIQRRLNPGDEWQNLPSYLPDSKDRKLVAYRVIDKNNASSILKSDMLASEFVSTDEKTSFVYRIATFRFMMENPIGFKNGQQTFWNRTDIHYTVKAKDPYYGEEFQWNGVCLLAPYQLGPTLKSLKLKSMVDGTQPSFLSAEGELDFSKMDLTKIYKNVSVNTVQPNGMDLVLPQAYPEHEAHKLRLAVVSFLFNNRNNSSSVALSVEDPTFRIRSPYLNSTIYIKYTMPAYFSFFKQGVLIKGKEEGTFVVGSDDGAYKLPEVKVVYEK